MKLLALRIVYLCLVLHAFASYESACAQSCFTDEQRARARTRIESMIQQHSDLASKYINTLSRQSAALSAYHQCRRANGIAEELFSAITLQGDPCLRQISEHNELEERASTQKQMLDLIASQINTATLLFQNSETLRCK